MSDPTRAHLSRRQFLALAGGAVAAAGLGGLARVAGTLGTGSDALSAHADGQVRLRPQNPGRRRAGRRLQVRIG